MEMKSIKIPRGPFINDNNIGYHEISFLSFHFSIASKQNHKIVNEKGKYKTKLSFSKKFMYF